MSELFFCDQMWPDFDAATLDSAITAVLRGALTWLQQSYLLRLETKMAAAGASRFLWHLLRLPVEFRLEER